MIENGCIQLFIFGKSVDGIVALCDDIVVQAFFEVACSIGPFLASHEIVAVFIYILLDKSVYQFRLTAQLGILYHRVQNVLALLIVIITVWVEVCNEFQDICHVDDITVQQFQTEINVAKPCFSI